MKLTKILLCILILGSCSSKKQKLDTYFNPKNSLEKFRLHNKVKKLSLFKVNAKNDTTEDAEIILKEVIKFDKIGHITEHKRYDIFGNVEWKETYCYNHQHQLIKQIQKYTASQNEVVSTYTYNADSTVATHNILFDNEQFHSQFYYDVHKNIVKSINTNNGINSTYVVNNTYDSKNRLVKTYTKTDSTYTVTVNKYNEQGHLESQIIKDNNIETENYYIYSGNTLTSSKRYVNQVLESQLFFDHNFYIIKKKENAQTTEYTHQLDHHNNWTKRYNKKDPNNYQYREIEYYN